MRVFVPAADDSLIPRWLNRLNSLGMKCEIHPDFSFASHSGFLPFKVELQRSSHAQLVGNEYLTGFEFNMTDFDLNKELESITPKRSFVDRLIGRKTDPQYFASREIDARLARCTKEISCTWGSADSLELRMATLSAAILAEQANGVFSYPAEDVWCSETGEVENAMKEAEAYETSINPKQLRLHKFEGWL
jgi:hypothetical protein